MSHQLSIMVHTPAHSGIGEALTYTHNEVLAAGTLVRVPLGKRETLGITWSSNDAAPQTDLKLRAITGVLGHVAPLSAPWMHLVEFAARYYQRSVGEVALAALPNQLRALTSAQWERKLKRPTPTANHTASTVNLPQLTPEQSDVLTQIQTQRGPFLLFGNTGSGKTEVYLRAAQAVLEQDKQAQILVMVPEINLTPQLEARFKARFAPLWGDACLVTMHSGLTPAQRMNHWLAAHTGRARIVLGTRMAVFASMPHLKLIVVDEEHDPSYKQQEGARYSARDLAIYRGHLEHVQVILGSATPSLESWHHSRAATQEEGAGRYVRLLMPSRIGDGALPAVRRVDMNHQPRHTIFSEPLLQAMRERVQRGEQVLVLLNRRGYAPVLHCKDCGWKSECPHCSAYRVFHKIDRSLRCHHCGFAQAVPRACPSCGNLDISPLGRGTEQLEEHLAELLGDFKRPEGQAVRIARIDADSTRLKGELDRQLADMHAGEVDILVGTQMIAKGHDFRRVSLVAALDPDGALFSSDFRAPERLFSLLMQAAGRAGRDANLSQTSPCEMWVQTFHPQHALFEALKQHDFARFAEQQLQERREANLPPFSFQALVRADAKTQSAAQDFLNAARELADALAVQLQVDVYPAVPMTIQRVANVERAQMLVECLSRKALQQFLSQWQAQLHGMRAQHKQVIRWAIDVDPLAI
jgi:primosomal protein N' (replication factor Y) (superfamily II helicase)